MRLAIEFDLHPPSLVANIVLDAAKVLGRKRSAAQRAIEMLVPVRAASGRAQKCYKTHELGGLLAGWLVGMLVNWLATWLAGWLAS